jgi:environmental stress-induced protein Ves
MRILRSSGHRRMPWKNGGGETTEIAAFPEGAGLDDFQWRVSMARVDGSGPFSTFPGIDRTLAILEGAGIVLDVAGEPQKRLTLESAPHAFPADAATSADLIDGSVLDFNVMSRRGACAHTVTRHRAAHVSAPGHPRLVLCSQGSVNLVTDGQSDRLDAYDAVLLDHTESVEHSPLEGSLYYVVEFRTT